MTPHTPESEASFAPAPPPSPAVPVSSPALVAKARRWRWGLFVVAALLLACGAAFAWSKLRQPVPAIPPLPADVQDREVLRAVESYRQKVLDKPFSADVWGKYGMVLLANQFDKEADVCFAEAAHLAPHSPKWPYARGEIALFKHDHDAAVPLLRQALTLANDAWPEYRTTVRLELAVVLLERQELDEAERLFREEWDRSPDQRHPRAALGLGLVALARGDHRTAAEFLSTPALLHSPYGRKMATGHLASLARERGDRTAAAAYTQETADLPADVAWPDPFLDAIPDLQVGKRRRERDIAQLEHDQRYQEAAQIYLNEIKEQPTEQAYVGAAINLARIGSYDEAQQLLNEALRLDPDSAMAHYTLSLTLFTRAERQPDSAQAKEWFRDTVKHAELAAKQNPGLARNYLHWGLALKYLGKPVNEVAPLLRKGVTCLPVDVDLQFALERFFGGGPTPRSGNPPGERPGSWPRRTRDRSRRSNSCKRIRKRNGDSKGYFRAATVRERWRSRL